MGLRVPGAQPARSHPIDQYAHLQARRADPEVYKEAQIQWYQYGIRKRLALAAEQNLQKAVKRAKATWSELERVGQRAKKAWQFFFDSRQICEAARAAAMNLGCQQEALRRIEKDAAHNAAILDENAIKAVWEAKEHLKAASIWQQEYLQDMRREQDTAFRMSEEINMLATRADAETKSDAGRAWKAALYSEPTQSRGCSV